MWHVVRAVLRLVLWGVALAIASLFLALSWSDHDTWWITSFPEWAMNAIYAVAKPLLSNDLSEAEDQLNFLFYWVPAFLLMLALCLMWGWRGGAFRRRSEL